MNAARARGKDFSFIQEFKEVSTTLMCFFTQAGIKAVCE